MTEEKFKQASDLRDKIRAAASRIEAYSEQRINRRAVDVHGRTYSGHDAQKIWNLVLEIEMERLRNADTLTA